MRTDLNLVVLSISVDWGHICKENLTCAVLGRKIRKRVASIGTLLHVHNASVMVIRRVGWSGMLRIFCRFVRRVANAWIIRGDMGVVSVRQASMGCLKIMVSVCWLISVYFMLENLIDKIIRLEFFLSVREFSCLKATLKQSFFF